MYGLHRLSFVCAGILLLLAVAAAPAVALNKVHIVQRGETLAAIADRYNVPLSVLADRNGIEDRDFIFVGQRVEVPASETALTLSPGIHTVRVGESLPAIAALYRVPLEMILFFNGVDASSVIWVGQPLLVPVPAIIAARPSATAPAPIAVDLDATSYRVRPGDTLFAIARAYGLDIRVLATHNRLQDTEKLFAGQILSLPGETDVVEPLIVPAVTSPQAAVQEPPLPSTDPASDQTGLPQGPDSFVHIVQPGETLSDIATRFQATVLQVSDYNGLDSEDLIVPGQRLLIPRGPEPERRLPASTAAFAWEEAQIVSFYGHPGVPAMGVLGQGSPRDVAARVAAMAERYDQLNGHRGALPAYHLIVGVAQAGATPDGAWIRRLSHNRIAEYVEAAREAGLLLFLDTQIGWSDPLAEVKLLTPFLREPFVHVALDPEFATEPLGVRPGLALGSISGEQVNEVQRFLAAFVREEGLPPKFLMVHQFAARMLRDRSAIEDYEGVLLSFDMDGFGGATAKLNGYGRFALPAPSERPALKLFFLYDTPVMTPEQVQGLDHPPDIIIYQ
ncbi:MAG: LysM peptidoglycan-binding domain-containing protein [Caldilineaceae bacterium]|nr:LysM peptidoglycan-binding domain-containing protein [Caldilineaceae bacterium]